MRRGTGWLLALGAAVALAAPTPAAAAGTRVWLQPGEQPGCAPVSVWAQADAGGEGTWALTPLAATADSGAHTMLGTWKYAGGGPAAIADLGPLPAGRYRLQVFGALSADDAGLNVVCSRPPAPAYAPVVQPLAATGGSAPADAQGDTVPPVQLVALPASEPAGPSPITIALLCGLLVSLFLVGWSFVRR